MGSILSDKDILIYGNDEDFLELNKKINDNFKEFLDDVFNAFYNMVNEGYDKKEIIKALESIDSLFFNLLEADKINMVIDKLGKIYSLDISSLTVEKTLSMMIKKYKDLKNKLNENSRYALLKHIVFDKKDIEFIRRMLNFENSLIYQGECKKILEDIVAYYVTCDKEDIYYEELIRVLLVKRGFFINTNNKCKIYNMLKLNKKKKHIVKILKLFEENDEGKVRDFKNRFQIYISNDNSLVYNVSREGRYDFLQDYVITIDDESSLCLDDGISLKCNDNGTYTLYVHIIDIYDILKNNYKLDEMAYDLGEALYLKDDIIPMLPFYISNGIGSMLHNEIRNVITYIIELDKNFDFAYDNIEDYFKVVKGVCRNGARLSYASVDDILINGCRNENLMKMLNNLGALSAKFRSENKQKELYHKKQNETMKKLGSTLPVESKLLDIYTGASIVQETMILANRLLPELFASKDLPFVYRVCSNANSNDAKDYLKNINSFVKQSNIDKKMINYQQLEKISAELLSDSCYSTVNIGHAGLGVKYYSHSTSPARRYADVISEKLIYELLFLEKTNLGNVNRILSKLDDIVSHLNERSKINESLIQEYSLLLRKSKVRRKQ